ncbi:MAG TPA: DMT family transporter [Gaiellaceae bacterium]|jgi:drug/metabolite transporter (DMT)-like permease
MTTRANGIALAFVAALVSGVSIYVNAHAVRHFGDATVYTTAKNAVAGVLLLALLVIAPRRKEAARPRLAHHWPALAAVAIVGGSVPFVLFFEGLARAQATDASFIQKTLVVWVALLAVPILRERFRAPHAAAIVLLIVGQAWLVGHLGTVTFGSGEAMILGATLLWAVETVFVKHLLGSIPSRTLAAARMGGGTVALLGWLAVTGKAGQLGGFGVEQWRWILLTGLLLTAYVATWYAALARAQAVDVTAMLVFGAVVTALLSGAADGAPVNVTGAILVAAGSATMAWAAVRRKPVEATP